MGELILYFGNDIYEKIYIGENETAEQVQKKVDRVVEKNRDNFFPNDVSVKISPAK